MVMARFRQFAWMLLLVLFAGVSLPVLASAGPSFAQARAKVATVSHVHADGTAHTHAVKADVRTSDIKAVPSKVKTTDCSCCLTNTACALSCFGMALLPMNVDWAWASTLMPWSYAVVSAPSGVGPSGDIDPPRLVSLS